MEERPQEVDQEVQDVEQPQGTEPEVVEPDDEDEDDDFFDDDDEPEVEE